MSYARFGWDRSDVYLFFNTDGEWECCACQLNEADGGRVFPPSFRTPSIEAFLHHLGEHDRAGHRVPPSAYGHIRADVAEMAAEAAGVVL